LIYVVIVTLADIPPLVRLVLTDLEHMSKAWPSGFNLTQLEW
jgi:hypothetical protein